MDGAAKFPALSNNCWLPIDFLCAREQVKVRWIDVRGDRLTAPFFHITLRQLRSKIPPAQEKLTDLKEFVCTADALPTLKPSGVIFHVSRCGSTLLTNALRIGEKTAIIPEARPFGKLFLPGVFKNSPFPPEEWNGVRQLILDSLVRLYGYYMNGASARLVIKCHAASILGLPLIRQVWPTVPFLVIIRNPIEVIISNLDAPATWVRAKYAPIDDHTIFGWTGAETQKMSTEEYCARGIGKFCDIALNYVGERLKVIDYRSIGIESVRKIANFFQIPLDVCSDKLRDVMKVDAKHGQRIFKDDSALKQSRATDLVRHAAERWAFEPYERLRRLEG